MFNKFFFVLSTIICLAIVTDAGFARSKSKSRKGLAERLHTTMVFGRKLCMTEHMHYGMSSWNASKKTSYKEAVNSWRVFTKVEYRTRWSHFRMARHRKVSCVQNGYRLWRCEAKGRPCRKR